MQVGRGLGAALIMLACTGVPSTPDGGAGGGGTSGGGTSGGAGGATAGGGSAGGTSGGVAGGSADSGCVALPFCSCTGAGGGAVAFSNRLFVATRGRPDGGPPTVQLWNAIPSLATNPPGVVQPLLAGTPVALVGGAGPLPAHTITVVSEDAAPIQEWIGNLVPPCDPPAVLEPNAFGVGRATRIAGRLWYLRRPGEVVRLAGPLEPRATFAAPGQPLRDFAYDPVSDRLFAAHSGGVVAWSAASSRAGDAGMADLSISTFAASQLDVASGRLFGSAGSGTLAVWVGATTAVSPSAPSFALDAGQTASIRHHTVVAGHLFVTLADRVLVYRDIAATTGDRAPDVVVTDPSLAAARKSAVGQDGGRLFVLMDEGVAVFSAPLGAPALEATLTTGIDSAVDLVYAP